MMMPQMIILLKVIKLAKRRKKRNIQIWWSKSSFSQTMRMMIWPVGAWKRGVTLLQ